MDRAAVPVPRQVVVLGAEGVGLAQRIARAGIAVSLSEPDPADAARALDMLRAAAISAVVDVVPSPGDVAPDTLVLVSQGWNGPCPAGCLRMGQGFCVTGGVAELIGAPRAAHGLARRLGLFPVVPVGGAIAPMLASAMDRQAGTLILEGLEPWELDEALEQAGFGQGPFARQDGDGVDAALARLADGIDGVSDQGDDARLVMARMVTEGRLGRKAGVGWYRYPGGGGRVVDPLIEDLVREEAWFAGRAQRAVTAEEGVARLTAALMAAAHRLVARGVSHAAIDRVAVSGLGYPARWGGPLHHVDSADPAEFAPWARQCGLRLTD